MIGPVPKGHRARTRELWLMVGSAASGIVSFPNLALKMWSETQDESGQESEIEEINPEPAPRVCELETAR